MNIRKAINEGVATTERRNKHSAEQYKKKLLLQIEDNLLNKKQTIEANKGLINRYKGIKPRALTQMQAAMKEAV